MTTFDMDILNELGKFTKALRKEAILMIKEEASSLEIITYVEKKMFSNGYLPAFPCTICVNDMAAHLTVFDEDYILKKSDVVKLDFGVSKNGFITDNAVTVEIGTKTYEKLLEANLNGLHAAMEVVNLGVKMSEIGKAVNEIATKNGFNTIHNLSGHQISINDLHCGLSVPNYDNNDSRVVENGMELAIEPFFTVGSPKVKSAGNSNILHLVNYKSVRDPIAKKVLDHIKKNFPHLPFSKRWLLKEVAEELGIKDGGFEKRKVLYAINALKSNSVIYEYDALSTVDGAIVSQFEDAVVFESGRKTIITRL